MDRIERFMKKGPKCVNPVYFLHFSDSIRWRPFIGFPGQRRSDSLSTWNLRSNGHIIIDFWLEMVQEKIKNKKVSKFRFLPKIFDFLGQKMTLLKNRGTENDTYRTLFSVKKLRRVPLNMLFLWLTLWQPENRPIAIQGVLNQHCSMD